MLRIYQMNIFLVKFHYKESYTFQPMCLRLLSKSTIFVILDTIVLRGTW